MSETKKLHLRKIELNSHSFSEHVLVRSLNSFNIEKMHTFVNSADRQVAPCGGNGNSMFVVSLSPVLLLNCFSVHSYVFFHTNVHNSHENYWWHRVKKKYIYADTSYWTEFRSSLWCRASLLKIVVMYNNWWIRELAFLGHLIRWPFLPKLK